MSIWSGEQRARLALEEQLLSKLPGFSFTNREDSSQTAVNGQYTSSTEKSYWLWVWLGPGYPHQAPDLYVQWPRSLKDFWGKPLEKHGTSHSMHLWKSKWPELTNICHWKSEFWSASQTIVSVLAKGILWVEAYEAHLRTGNTIDFYSRGWPK